MDHNAVRRPLRNGSRQASLECFQDQYLSVGALLGERNRRSRRVQIFSAVSATISTPLDFSFSHESISNFGQASPASTLTASSSDFLKPPPESAWLRCLRRTGKCCTLPCRLPAAWGARLALFQVERGALGTYSDCRTSWMKAAVDFDSVKWLRGERFKMGVLFVNDSPFVMIEHPTSGTGTLYVGQPFDESRNLTDQAAHKAAALLFSEKVARVYSGEDIDDVVKKFKIAAAKEIKMQINYKTVGGVKSSIDDRCEELFKDLNRITQNNRTQAKEKLGELPQSTV